MDRWRLSSRWRTLNASLARLVPSIERAARDVKNAAPSVLSIIRSVDGGYTGKARK